MQTQADKVSQKSLRQLGMPIPSQAEWLAKIQKSKYLECAIDIYNAGGLVEELESRVARLLNKPAALFFPKGMVAQLCALKVASVKRKNKRFMLHPQSHIAYDEQKSYDFLVGLEAVQIGEEFSPFSIRQIKEINSTVAALTVELPLRRAGFKLTPWDELKSMSQWSQINDVHFHMDGARLWESTEFYQKSEAEISALFDSVYVSLYKGLGAIGGSVLAGEVDFIEDCKIWRTRFGGDFFTSFPFIISALDGLDTRLATMPELISRAKAIATELSSFSKLVVEKPHTNGFFIYVEGPLESLNKKALQLESTMGIKLFKQFNPSEQVDKQMAEIQVGADHAEISNQEIVEFFSRLFE